MREAFGLHWMDGEPWGSFHPDRNCYALPEAATTEESRITLEARYKPVTALLGDGTYKRIDFGVGYLSTQERFRFGRYGFVFELPEAADVWPAIWLIGKTEVDIVEAWSRKPQWWNSERGATYRSSPLVKHAGPGVVLGGEVTSLGLLKKPRCWAWHLRKRGENRVEMEWNGKELAVWYNGFLTGYTRDSGLLERVNDCEEGLQLVVDLFTTERTSLLESDHGRFVITGIEVPEAVGVDMLKNGSFFNTTKPIC